MQVFKFGGASVKDSDGVRNVTDIIGRFQQDKPVIVVSASGKTTNGLEDVVNAFWKKTGDAQKHLDKIKANHAELVEGLLGKDHPILDDLNDIYTEVEWVIEGEPQDSYDYIYDQIVSAGEFLSSRILSAFLQKSGIANTWLDARDVIRTDDHWREPAIIWDDTERKIQKKVAPMLEKGLVVTQGFIGSTKDNNTTTLGREGSDFTAAIFSYALRAKTMTIWKDVPGVLNADPRLFPEAVKIDRMSYEEAIEMTYYGAQVIHPKTMRPLQIRNVPLHVKCFLDPDAAGTVIEAISSPINYPPVIVVKKNQALLKVTSKDFYFINEQKLAVLFEALSKHRIKVNLMQNSAMSLFLCVDNRPDNISALMLSLIVDYQIEKIDGLEMLTVRHFNNDILNGLKYAKSIVLEEKTQRTAQLVIRSLN